MHGVQDEEFVNPETILNNYVYGKNNGLSSLVLAPNFILSSFDYIAKFCRRTEICAGADYYTLPGILLNVPAGQGSGFSVPSLQ